MVNFGLLKSSKSNWISTLLIIFSTKPNIGVKWACRSKCSMKSTPHGCENGLSSLCTFSLGSSYLVCQNTLYTYMKMSTYGFIGLLTIDHYWWIWLHGFTRIKYLIIFILLRKKFSQIILSHIYYILVMKGKIFKIRFWLDN